MEATEYFQTKAELFKFLVENLGFENEGAANAAFNSLADYEEEPYKSQTVCHGYLHNTKTDSYYELDYNSDYNWGAENFVLETTELKPQKIQKVIELTLYIPVTKGE